MITTPGARAPGVIGIGLDIALVGRMEKAARRHPGIIERIFSAQERSACLSKKNPYPSMAARFAAKEACMKALGTGWGMGVGFLDIQVVSNFGEPPSLSLHGQAAEHFLKMGGMRTHLSMTHDGDIAAAVVVIEGGATQGEG